MTDLTEREEEVVACLLLGDTNKQMADSLGISIETVKRHMTNICDKVGADNRVQVALWAMRREQSKNVA